MISQRDLRSEGTRRAWNAAHMRFHLANLENPDNIDETARRAVQEAGLLFIDGGDKALEAAIYAKFLGLGSGVLVHDVNYDAGMGSTIPETGDETRKFEAILRPLGFEMVFKAEAKTFNSCARYWERVTLPAK